MSKEPTTVEKLRGLRWGLFADSANTIFAQFTFFGSAFILFLSELGLSKAQIGFQLSLFPYTGLVALVIAPAVARFGYKRTFLTFWGVRKVTTAFLLLTPWVFTNFGPDSTVVFVTIIIAVFALCRAVGETGKNPWTHEYVPNTVRGKYAATSSIFTTIAGLLAVTIAGYVIQESTGLTGYMILIGAGVVSGVLAVWAFSFIPGGAPVSAEDGKDGQGIGLLEAIQDRGFVSFLIGSGMITLATVPMVSFLPLFMQEQVGLGSGQVVLLQNGTLLGTLLSSYLWGWAADRYGSKPVMISGVLLRILLPVFWLAMPRQAAASVYIAMGISVVQGVIEMAWAIGSARLLFVSIVPSEKKGDYMAIHYAWIGVVGGTSQLLGGRILEWAQPLSGQILGIVIDPYLPLFLLGLLLPIASILVFKGSPADSGVGVGQFAGLFLRGNPFQAMGTMIRYYRARDEHEAVQMTERLSRTRSPLTVDELLEALEDPRFNVRFEAVISIARMRPDPRLTAALVELLDGSELALSAVAAWALGRMGGDEGQEHLERALDSKYHSIQAQSARALGALGADEISPLLLSRLESEEDKGLRMAYASALGQLRSASAVRPLLSLLRGTNNEGARLELALSLARIVGDEQEFIRLLRQLRFDPGTAASQAVSGLRKQIVRASGQDKKLVEVTRKTATLFGEGKLDEGAVSLSKLIRGLPQDLADSDARAILEECAERLAELKAAQFEYILLALLTLGEVFSR